MQLSDIITVLVVGILLVLGLFIVKSYLRKLSQGCCGSGSGEKVKKNKVSDRDKSHYGYKTVLTVDGMVCSNCSARVENALNELEGVWATADVLAKTVTVLMKAPLDEKLLRSAVNELGAYTVMKVENIKN